MHYTYKVMFKYLNNMAHRTCEVEIWSFAEFLGSSFSFLNIV